MNNKSLLTLAFCVAVFFASAIHAAVPAFVQYSGRLSDGTTWGQSTQIDLTVRLYSCDGTCADADGDSDAEGEAENCGDCLFFEGLHPDVIIVDGYFSVQLGMCDAVGNCDPSFPKIRYMLFLLAFSRCLIEACLHENST